MYFLAGIFGMTPWFPVAAVFAFLAFGAMVSVDSAWADRIGLNASEKAADEGADPKTIQRKMKSGNRRFVILAVVFLLAAIFSMWMAQQTSTGTPG